MANDNNNQNINTLRDDVDVTKQQIHLAREKLKRLEEKEILLNRYFREDNMEHKALKEKLQAARTETEAGLATSQNDLINRQEEFENAWTSFIDSQSDPALNLNKLDSHYPILMMPLRIETRFKKIKNAQNQVSDQLWVRVFPDDCSIDTFEEILSETEIENARDFWADWLIAAGRENGQRAAWRTLVDSHGAGRAQYIMDIYRPEAADDIISAGNEEENHPVYLVITITEGSVSEHNRSELALYWERIWKADGNVDFINEAYNNFQPEGGEEQKKHLIQNYVPKNIGDDFSAIENRDEAEVLVRFLIFPSEDTQDIQQDTWTRAPRVRIMPERLYLIGYRANVEKLKVLSNPIPFLLECGPDPRAKENEMTSYLDSDLKITPGMKWMVDFDEAVDKGMGFVIDDEKDYDHQVNKGYDRLIVVGIRLSADKTKGKELTETLFHNHYYGNSGLSFLPVGTPTNNIQGAGSGYTEQEDADDSYDQLFKSEQEEADNEPEFWWSAADRTWFNKLMGFTPGFLNSTINTNGFDQREARAMNIALWPATLGYLFDTMMQPVFSDQQIEDLRSFFNFFVTGRGTIPSIRIDDQPYGILPTTVFSRISWFNQQYDNVFTHSMFKFSYAFYNGLYSILLKIQDDWKEMARSVPHIGQEGDPHQTMMDILGHHGGSVEFHTRIAQSLNHLYNILVLLYNQFAQTGEGNFSKIAEASDKYLEAHRQSKKGWILLGDLGYDYREIPEIYDKYFAGEAAKIDYLVDDQPLSEIRRIRAYATGDRNYIEWLIDAGKESLNKLREQTGFIDNKRPNTLLYLMLQHAMELGYFAASLQLYKSNELFTNEEMVRWAQREPDFIHISGLKTAGEKPETGQKLLGKPIHSVFPSESRYFLLEQKIEAITGDREKSVAQYITENLNSGATPASYLNDQIWALEYLKHLPTARLERLLTEHIDCVSYRFDAWKWGLIHLQLHALREEQQRRTNNEDENEGGSVTAEGLYLGSYGWLENVYLEEKKLTPISSFEDTELQDTFKPGTDQPIMQDDSNQGYIQAPSLNHAVTASVLRNAYISRASKENAEVFGINLSSERVRKALSVLEGIRQGQNLAALLGYQFERFMHDHDETVYADRHIYSLRRQFPLASDRMASTHTDDPNYQDAPIEALEARNVVHGSDLIDFVAKRLGPNGEPDYFNDLNLINVSEKEKQVIIKAIDHIRDTNDAVADLGLAESLHQLVQGNIDRAAGTLDTYSKGNYPQMPDVIQTPRSGVNITHRVGIHINPTPGGTYGDEDSPRSMAEPGLNAFLTDILPELNRIQCHVTIKNPDTAVDADKYPVTMEMLGVQPIDLLYMISDETKQAMTDLDDRIVHWVRNNYEPEPGQRIRPDTDISITYYIRKEQAEIDEIVSVFELVPLIKHLKAILLRSRPLKPTDVSLPNESDNRSEGNMSLDINRLGPVIQYIDDVQNEGGEQSLAGFVNLLEGYWDGESWTDEREIIQSIGDYIKTITSILHKLSMLSLPNTGYGFLPAWEKQQMAALMQKIKAVLGRWNQKESRYGELLDDYATAGADEKINILMKAERVISTEPTLNPDPATFYNEILTKKTAFTQHKDKLDTFIHTNHQGIADALSVLELEGILCYGSFDLIETDITDIRKACLVFAEDILIRTRLLRDDLSKRTDRFNILKTDHNEEADPARRVEIVQEMANLLLTENFKMIPSFEMIAEKKEEWDKALQPEKIEQLLTYQKQVLNNQLPVDDWFYGTARVREKMGHLEQVIFWAECFKDLSIELLPVQLPCLDPSCWFAMEFGATENLDKEALKKVFLENDHLLYTAYYHQQFDPRSTAYCGLLVDEWTETIPTEEETTGTAFHYDRPNTEPPQTMLLVTSPQLEENWIWQDLVDAVNETLDESKLRGVEPEQIDKTGYACFLPGTIAAITKNPITIAVNYLLSNQNFINNQPSDHE